MKYLFTGIIATIIYVNAMAKDSYIPSTGTLNLDSIVENGLEYNNVSVTISGYSYAPGTSPQPPTVPYSTSPVTNTFPSPVKSVTGAACTPGNVPTTWQASGPITPPSAINTPMTNPPSLNPFTLVFFRHGEEVLHAPAGTNFPLAPGTIANPTYAPYGDNGNMSSIGQIRAQQLPATLNQLFGCPNYTIAPTPSVELSGSSGYGGTSYNYVRPLATIEPTATELQFPIWTPYGAIPQLNSAKNPVYGVVYDLLTNTTFAPAPTSSPNVAFIAWEHNNIAMMVNSYILGSNGLTVNGLKLLPAGTPSPYPINGVNYQCQNPPPASWDYCDWDSVWVLQIQGNNACYLHAYENLNNAQQQQNCSNPPWPYTPVSQPTPVSKN